MEYNRGRVEEAFEGSMQCFREEIWDLEEANAALAYFEDLEDYIYCIGIKKAIDEYEIEVLSDSFVTTGLEEGFSNTK
tara:strand:+ start:293 stop:526 length:234 start_codon:yes stop_codon:yes gene_type:complete